MTGIVDSSGRALVAIRLRHPVDGSELNIDAWIDTGFTGELVIPRDQITVFGAPVGAAIWAALADGTQVELDTYVCLLEWFGNWRRIEIVESNGHLPLLGVGLLTDHVLRIDYSAKTLTID